MITGLIITGLLVVIFLDFCEIEDKILSWGADFSAALLETFG
jgi:hypothetical protein